ncbi:PEPxxWA-CTERM sorting domain-containing protein [Sphingomonas sp. RS2018]
MTMMKGLLAATMLAGSIAAATPATAAIVTSVQIRSNDILQVAELQLFANGVNVALGKTATATSVYQNGSAVASRAVDGDTEGSFPNIYHGNMSSGDVLTVDLGGAFDVTRISIFGRGGANDTCCGFRDNYTYTLFNGTTQVGSGNLDARATRFATASITAAVPEPATWAMMMLGFGAMAFALRRRAKVAATVRFA